MRRDYGPDVLAAGAGRRPHAEFPQVPAERGLVVEEAGGGFCGAVVDCEKHVVTLEDRLGKRRVFPLTLGGFLLEGRMVTLVRPGQGRAAGMGGTGRTASGSLAASRPGTAAGYRARVARASRIYVEGRHDAELVEKIWGDDLRELGVVVEYLAGIDHLPPIAAGFAPGPARRLGVLVDHLVSGSKESRIAAQVSSPHVLVVGHPFVDIWQAVKPASLGIAAWPAVPRGTPWKEGVLRALGWDGDTAAGWRRILGAANSYADLEPALLGRVEELIDFVTAPGTGDPAADV
ncbi:MAG TPA: DUF3097 domain-containing protein [Streptosporangiaceae bacterium]|jgi:hypothetical protein|nr:DUF3097 domain-containing protein [Streptosporangiaceae bacterium]